MKLNADCIRDVLLELENSLSYRTNEEGHLERVFVSLHDLDCILIKYHVNVNEYLSQVLANI